jgi:hypothetical protein
MWLTMFVAGFILGGFTVAGFLMLSNRKRERENGEETETQAHETGEAQGKEGLLS